MLIATFAVAFLLQSIALLWFGPLGKTATSLVQLNRPVSIGGVEIRKITIVAIVVAAVCLALLVLLLNRTSIGLHMRAAAHGLLDRAAARRAGEPRERGRGADRGRSRPRSSRCMLTVQFPTVTPTFALQETIIVLAGVVVGGMTRLLSATLGGFFIGYVSGLLGGALAVEPEPVPAVVRVRARDPRPARAAGRALHARRGLVERV